jgi:hydrogenase maturation protease
LLLEQLAAIGAEVAGDVELLTDFQLQIEHALDLEGRRAVLFIDAARPGVVDGVGLTAILADTHVAPVSHALSAPAVLRVATQLTGCAPPAWQLAVEGECFALREGLSSSAQRHMEQAFEVLLNWIATQRAAACPTPSLSPAGWSGACVPAQSGRWPIADG